MGNHLPLTTTFTPAASCLSNYTQGIWLALGPPPTTDCLPSGWDSSLQYFSPGVCPSGYHTACNGSTVHGQITESKATCCPSGFSCQLRTDLEVHSTYACTAQGSQLPSPLTVTSINGSAVSIYLMELCDNCSANAYGVSIRWQGTDFATTTSSTTALATSATTSFPTATAVAPTTTSFPTAMPVTPTTTADSISTDLSPGTKVSIGISVTLGALAVITGLAYLFLRYRPRINRNTPFQAKMQTDLHKDGIARPQELRDTTGPPQLELSGGVETGYMTGLPQLELSDGVEYWRLDKP